MYGRSENIIKITKKEEDENEAEKIKRRFNFFHSNNNKSSSSFESNNNSSFIINEPNKHISEGKMKNNYLNSKNKQSVLIVNEVSGKESKNKIKNSSSTTPIKINNVVNIVNNNYSNVITNSVNNPRDFHSTSKHSSNHDTQRRNSNNKFINPAIFDAIKNASEDSLPSFIREIDNSNNIERSQSIKNTQSSMKDYNNIPSEDIIDYDKSNYGEKINLIGFRNYIKKPSFQDKHEEESLVEENESKMDENMKFDNLNYSKKKSIFRFNQAYDLSNRLINDECRHHHTIIKNPECKFIERIREEKKNFQYIKLKSINSLNDDSIFNILNFIFPQYDILIKSNKLFANKICLALNNKFSKVINSFKDKLDGLLELQEYYFRHTPFKKGKNAGILFLI